MLNTSNEKSKPIGEMLERNLIGVLQIFYPNAIWETQKRFAYDPDNKRKFYQVDVISAGHKIVWEYDGPNHFNDTWKFQRDLDRDIYFNNLGYKVKRWPYFCQLTRDIAKNFFGKDFSEEKYLSAINYIYGVESENKILAPGWHKTKFTPGSWIEKGVDRLISELEEMPESFKHQLAFALKIYIEKIGDPFLIIGSHKKLHRLVKIKINRDYTNYKYSNLDT
tara:strand:+ start:497 stop:1162 length:666 start_codon:yes stop_codon:yes gene_type:complete